jgi:ubiquilin
MMNTPGMQSLLRQVLSNQNATQSLLSPENMRQLGEMMGNPQLGDQMRTGMSNPQMMQAMTNPRVLNAIMQLQQALRVLNEEMPGMFPNIPLVFYVNF